MEAVLKKHFWVVNLVFLVLAAWLMAGSVNGYIAHRLREIPSLSKAIPTQHANKPEFDLHANYQVIIDRNLFNSALSIPVETIENGPGIDEASGHNLLDGDGVISSLRASLVGTIVADPAGWSMAMITDQVSSETGVYRIEDSLMAEAIVVAILPQRVVINHNGVREYLELQEEAQPKSTQHGKKPTTASAPKSTLGEGIKKTGENEYSIERGEIDKTLSNLNSIAMQARIVPSFKNGEANGFKLFAIRPGSLYSKIGIQNGDIIHKINGFSMNSPDKALEVYQKLKSARSIDVELTRRGRDEKMTYNIQ